MIMAMVAMVTLTASALAQKIDRAYVEARFLTEKMVDELGLSDWQREKVYQMNLSYLTGINSYRDIDSKVWKNRNKQLKGLLTSSQWKRYKNASYFYRPIGWRDNAYVHNIYSKYSSRRPSWNGNRGNRPVTLPAQGDQRPVEMGRPPKNNDKHFGRDNGKRDGNSSNRSFGSLRR